MSFILLGILNSQVEAEAGGAAYELIESQVLSSAAASVTFSSIPQTYKHLQIRMVVRSTGGGNPRVLTRLNSDSGANYASHNLYGDGSTVGSEGNASQTGNKIYFVPNESQPAGAFGAAVYDLLDYTNTNKNTTARIFAGAGGLTTVLQDVGLHSFLWNNTAAVNTILLSADGQTFAADTRFSLYGVKG